MQVIYLFTCRRFISSVRVCTASSCHFTVAWLSSVCVCVWMCQSLTLKALQQVLEIPPKPKMGRHWPQTSECQARISEFFKCRQSEVPAALLLMETRRRNSWNGPLLMDLYYLLAPLSHFSCKNPTFERGYAEFKSGRSPEQTLSNLSFRSFLSRPQHSKFILSWD